MKSMFRVVDEIANYPHGNMWGRRILYLQPKNVVELGTGQGATGAAIMRVLPPESRFTTINYDYPSNCVFGEMLVPYLHDRRLKVLMSDTTKESALELVPDGIDLLYIDTHHFAWQAALELHLWQRKLVDGAVVICDDLDHNDMMAFWGSVHYDKVVCGNQGVFRYDASAPYANLFPVGLTPKETALYPR